MIVSHEKKFVFIKTKKTAGTSMEIALSRFCGEGDIITPITPADEELRVQYGGRGPQNYLLPFSKYGLRDWGRLAIRKRRAKAFYNHMPGPSAKARLGDKIWQDYFTFCFDRDPLEKVISLYYWKHRKTTSAPDINDFVLNDPEDLLTRWAARAESMYWEGQSVIVDKVFRFEDMQEVLPELRRELGLSEDLVLPQAKSQVRKDRSPAREVLSEESIARIGRLFSKEIDLLGYELG